MAKVALGTVQFGLDYGITNNHGKPSLQNVEEILKLARQKNITLLDTARAYGSAESVIGELAPGNSSWAKIVTKLPPLLKGSSFSEATSENPISELRLAFEMSLSSLQRSQVTGLMVHQSADLLSSFGCQIWDFLNELKDQAKVKLIGASVYSPDEAEALMSKYNLDIIQLPANLYDGRFHKTGMLRQLKSAGVEIHLRSLYLQGVLLTQPDELPAKLAKLRKRHERLYQEIKSLELSPATACLSAYLNHADIDYVVIGCQNKLQLERLIEIAAVAENIDSETAEALRLDYTIDDATIINPTLWN
jgi:aryl-alcohol dehydrogenase-like predicted oxidoreductase